MINDVVDRILSSDHIVVVSHTHPDADAYASSSAIYLTLKKLDKQVFLLNEQGSLPRFLGIPGVSEVTSVPPPLADDSLLIVCDCGDEIRVGDTLLNWFNSAPFVINIDHHYSNSLFGNINLVVDKASSTAEIIFDLIRALEIRSKKTLLDVDISSALLAGIMADTGGFRYLSTTAYTFSVAHDLVQAGAVPHTVSQYLFANNSLAAVKLQADALSKMELQFDNHVAIVKVTQAMLNEHGAELADGDVLSERSRDIAGVIVSVLFKEDKEMWRISLRSKSQDYDVSKVASHFGGGGHKAAAAFRWKKPIELLYPLLYQQIGELFQ